MKRFSAEHFEFVERQGKRIPVHMAVYSREWRNRRLPLPAPKPHPPEIMRQIRDAAEGKTPPGYGHQDWTRLSAKVF